MIATLDQLMEEYEENNIDYLCADCDNKGVVLEEETDTSAAVTVCSGCSLIERDSRVFVMSHYCSI